MRDFGKKICRKVKQSDVRLRWETWYSDEKSPELASDYHPWLEICVSGNLLNPEGIVLDLGCGRGFDSRYLSQAGFKVVAYDYSLSAPHALKVDNPLIKVVQGDMRDGFPFRHSVFSSVVANLSLHYFSLTDTNKILQGIRQMLISEGVLIARLNSKKDENYQKDFRDRKAMIEPDYFACEGLPRRFFDEASLDELLSNGWKVQYKQEKTIHRFNKRKVLWEFIAEKN